MAEGSGTFSYERVGLGEVKVVYEENGKRTETIVRYVPEGSTATTLDPSQEHPDPDSHRD